MEFKKVERPRSFDHAMFVASLFLMDSDSFALSCIAPQPWAEYSMKVILLPAMVLWMVVAYRCRACVACFGVGQEWVFERTVNFLGMVTQMTFTTLNAVSMTPLMCFAHPNGRHSVILHPGVFCGDRQHWVMSFIGSLLLTLLLAYLALCCFAAYSLPAWSSKSDRTRVKSFLFLTGRFRPDRWWFGLPMLCRGTLISLPMTLATGSAQVVLVSIVLFAFLLMQTSARPWKVPLANLVDILLNACLLMVAASGLPLRGCTRNPYCLEYVRIPTRFGLYWF